MIYLASPYTKGSAESRMARFHAVTQVAARLIEQKNIVYSPITMTHPIDLVLATDNETLGSDFWVNFDESFMAHCTQIVVLTLPGWRESSGVAREIEYFKGRGIAPSFVAPEEFGITREIAKFAAAFD